MNQATEDQRAAVGRIVKARNLTAHTVGDVTAYVNHGRWVANCACGGAELVAEGFPFECGSCGGTATVVWPDDQTEIVRLLDKRRRPNNQNWNPAEPVGLLAAENKWMVN